MRERSFPLHGPWHCRSDRGPVRQPETAGCKKLRRYKDHWRIRIGNHGVIYILDDSERTVTVTHVAHRREVYE